MSYVTPNLAARAAVHIYESNKAMRFPNPATRQVRELLLATHTGRQEIIRRVTEATILQQMNAGLLARVKAIRLQVLQLAEQNQQEAPGQVEGPYTEAMRELAREAESLEQIMRNLTHKLEKLAKQGAKANRQPKKRKRRAKS